MPKQDSCLILLALTMVIAIQACQKKIIPTTTDEIPLRGMDFYNVQAKGTLTYQQGKKSFKDIDVTIRIRKDSVIWMNFSLFGIVGGRALLNHDSLSIISSLSKEYIPIPLTKLSERLHVSLDYPIIQSLLLGQLLKPIIPQDKISKLGAKTVLEQQRDSLLITTYLSSARQQIDSVSVSAPSTEQALLLRYSYEDIETRSHTLPIRTEIEMREFGMEAEDVQDKIRLEYTNFRFNDPALKFPFIVPSQYDRRP